MVSKKKSWLYQVMRKTNVDIQILKDGITYKDNNSNIVDSNNYLILYLYEKLKIRDNL